MVSFSSGDLSTLLAMFFWPFVRVLALVATDPIFGSRTIPGQVKIGFSILLTLAIAPALSSMPAVSPFSAYGLLIVVQQVVIGMAMGLVMRVVFTAIEMAGHLAGLQMGLGFAMFFDPQHGAQVPVVSQFASLFGILSFFAMDGHLVVISTLVESFRLLPVQITPLAADGFKLLFLWGQQIFITGLMLSLPVVAALLITNLAIGVMTRAAPQFNVFAVGFPLTVSVGFLVLYLTLPYWSGSLGEFFNTGMATAMRMLRTLSQSP